MKQDVRIGPGSLVGMGAQPAIHTPDAMEHQLASRCGIPHVLYEINAGTAGPAQAARRGLMAFRAATGVLLGGWSRPRG